MSLETQIAALVAAANSLTATISGKMGAIDDKVDAAVAVVPATIRAEMTKTLYVDPAGSDANSGTSWAAAKRTIRDAINSMPRGSSLLIYLKGGVIHEHATTDIDLTAKVVQIIGDGHVYNDPATYAEIIAVPALLGDDSVWSPGMILGPRSFVGMTGVKISTAKLTAAHAGKAHPVWQTSFFKTMNGQGYVRMQHAKVDIFNGALMYQHTVGSIGLGDLMMRNVTINKVSLVGLPVTTGYQQMMGTYGVMAVPFSLYGVEMIRQGAANWGELISADMSLARTNLSLT
ncbi:TPA: hypothetical protein ACKPXH_003955 [Pseudomonas aeruginosa]